MTLTRPFVSFVCTEGKLRNLTKQALTICSCNYSALFAGDNYIDIGVFYEVCFFAVTPFPSSALREATVVVYHSKLIPPSAICADCRSL